jgi:uncharacterized protein
VAGDAKVIQRANHGFFHPKNVFFNKVARAPQIDQRVGHHLAGAVKSHLPAAVGLNHWDVSCSKNVFGLTGNALGEDGFVLAQPQLIWGVCGANICEIAHAAVSGGVIHQTEVVGDQGDTQRVQGKLIMNMSRIIKPLCTAMALVGLAGFAQAGENPGSNWRDMQEHRDGFPGGPLHPDTLAKKQTATLEQDMNQALEAYSLDDYEKAEKAFRVLAKKGVGLAQYNLAMMHLRDEVKKPDFALARKLLQRAVQAGVVLAHHAMSKVHELGAGVPVSLPESNRWLESGAQLGHDESQLGLATNLYLGRGTAKNLERAAHWFREAAKTGDEGAQYMIASMYESGEGVPQDFRLAAYWYDLAAKNGDVAAKVKLKEVQDRLKTAS